MGGTHAVLPERREKGCGRLSSFMHRRGDLGHVGGGTGRDKGRVQERGIVFQDKGV